MRKPVIFFENATKEHVFLPFSFYFRRILNTLYAFLCWQGDSVYYLPKKLINPNHIKVCNKKKTKQKQERTKGKQKTKKGNEKQIACTFFI